MRFPAVLVCAVVVAVILATASTSTATPTPADEAAAVQALTTLANENNGRVAELVRFAFHSTFLGAHGCLDLDEPDNAGLETIKARVDALFDARGDRFGGMSRADFWALAGIVGVRVAAGNQAGRNPTVPSLEMRYGREDRPESCVGAGVFPNALGGIGEVMGTLGVQYNMTAREVTVLMGAHALGAADVDNSGFVGPWAPPTNRLDNGFYRELAEVGTTNRWRQVPAPALPGRPAKYQWVRGNFLTQPGPPLMMLNTDMALLRAIEVDGVADGQTSVCPRRASRCPRAAAVDGVSTADVVEEMAADNDKFLSEFAEVFTKMIEVNTTALQAAAGSALEVIDTDGPQ